MENLQKILSQNYGDKYRSMPWRDVINPYWIFASEIMLQQTQVDRVVPKFESFIRRFPDVGVLARAPLADVIGQWSGLGYNRRARFIHLAAKEIIDRHGGVVPSQTDLLVKLPGVGPNTAGAIMVYAYDRPELFIETNIRTVFIYHFFPKRQKVADSELLPLIDSALDRAQPRRWYWAVMDYGAYLKRVHGNFSTRSKLYKKQSRFEGSRRQIRGQVLRSLGDGSMQRKTLADMINDPRTATILEELERDGLVTLGKDDVALAR